jgi:MFS family permease
MASELRQGWRVVSAATLGAALGISGLLTYNAGLFQADLAAEIGLSRTGFGFGVFMSTVAIALAVPFVGRMVDRYGARPVAAWGSAFLALGFVALAEAATTPALYVAIMMLTGLLASGCTPVPFTRAVSAAFDRSRGLALGITQVGIGVSAAIVPPLIATVIARHGWRTGFLALAALAAVGIVPAILGLPGKGQALALPDRADIATVRRSRLFLVQLSAFVAMAIAFAGMLSHFVPMLRDAGMPIERAGALAGMIGLSVIVSRVLIGWLADRIEPAWLGSASCLLCALGCLLLARGGMGAALPGAIALGTAMGAEADLLAILTSRHFPLSVYSRVYAPQYAAFILAAGISPMWIGYLADQTGGYTVALVVCAGLLIVPAILFAQLPRLRRETLLAST